MLLLKSSQKLVKLVQLEKASLLLIGAVVLLFFGGCALTMSRPKLEMSLCSTAFIAARDAKANVLASNLYKKAEDNLLKGQSAYKRKYFNKAKQYALLCREYSEQAEFEAIRKGVMGEKGTTEGSE